MRTSANRPVHVWRVPLLLGVLTLVGLVAGLLGAGLWDAVAIAALGLPVLVGAWHALRPLARRGR